jgi:hypothetical protein
MSGKSPSSLLRRIERQWVERIKSLRQGHARMLQRLFGNTASLIPIPIRTIVDRRRLDQRRSRD